MSNWHAFRLSINIKINPVKNSEISAPNSLGPDFLAQTDFSGFYDPNIYKQLTKDLKRMYISWRDQNDEHR